ncbi:MAG: 2OG-Fe(II) oxygenase [Hyphomicrobiales bacterium]|nr:2OG-Fe(II) oxygenase [Hyphomicrobiales bacterium]
MSQPSGGSNGASSQVSGGPVVKRDLFSVAECEQLLELPIPWEEARLSGQDKDVSAAQDVKTASRRLIPLTNEFTWIYQRLGHLVKGSKALGLDITTIHAPLKIQRYEQGGFHRWHNDIANPRYRDRKLGITVQLSDPDTYIGGDFQFFDYPDPISIPRTIGCGAIFPAYMVHQVAPVDSGVRCSLTAWVLGPPLR